MHWKRRFSVISILDCYIAILSRRFSARPIKRAFAFLQRLKDEGLMQGLCIARACVELLSLIDHFVD